MWIDMHCLDPGSPSEPQLHPVYLMSSERLVVLLGPTYLARGWCAVFELFMFVEAGCSARNIDVLPILGATLPTDNVDVASCKCALKSELFAMEAVIASCGYATKLNRRLSDIFRLFVVVKEVSVRSATHRVHAIQTEQCEETNGMAKASRRLSSTISLSEELGHLSRQFEKMKPGCWWQVVMHNANYSASSCHTSYSDTTLALRIG